MLKLLSLLLLAYAVSVSYNEPVTIDFSLRNQKDCNRTNATLDLIELLAPSKPTKPLQLEDATLNFNIETDESTAVNETTGNSTEQLYSDSFWHAKEPPKARSDLNTSNEIDKSSEYILLSAVHARANKTGSVCFKCSSFSGRGAPANANCSRDIRSIESALDMNIGFGVCAHGCYTSVLRIGAYVTTYRGCYSEKHARQHERTGAFFLDSAGYNCSRAYAVQQSTWWNCNCNDHYCNRRMPSV